ncbi:MAG: ATP-binding protein [Halopseudomonas aestusnigri]
MDRFTRQTASKRIRLHHVLFIVFSLISIIPVLFLAVWAQKSAIENEYSAIKDKHLLLANNVSGALSRYASDAELIFRISTESLMNNQSIEQIPNLLKIVQFGHICITDKTGRIYNMATIKPGMFPRFKNGHLPPKTLKKLSDTIAKAKANPSHVIFSRAFLNSFGKPTLYLVKAEADGSMAFGSLKTDFIVNIGNKISFGKLGHAAIVDQAGQILAHPNAKWRSEIKDLSAVKPVKLMMAKQTGVTTFYSPSLKADMIAGYTVLPKIGWGVMVPQPISELEDRASGVHLVVLIISAVGIAAAALMSWWLARYLSMPMQAVVKAAGDVSAGRLNARIPSFHSFVLREAGDLVHSFNSMVDELEKVECRLRTSEERFREFASTASDWLWETDPHGRIIWESESRDFGYRGKRFTEIQGKTREQLAGDLMSEKEWQPYRDALVKHLEINDFEYRYLSSQGETFHALINGTPLFDEAGKYLGHRGAASDITKRKNIEAALEKSKECAEKANRSKSEFLANMSHDLRTPLNAIIGFSDIMRRKTFGGLGHPKYDEYASDIHNSGTLLVSLINDILDLSKIEAGKYELAEETLKLESLIKISFRQLQVMAEDTDQKLVLEIPKNFPSLLGDKRALIQILNNLISNAIKYTHGPGTVHVSTKVNEENCIILSVRDNGMGMSEDDLEHALEAFEQTNRLHPRRHEGTGLGLYLCISFMKLFGGSLEIESEVGKGTTVTLKFPKSRTLSFEEVDQEPISFI